MYEDQKRIVLVNTFIKRRLISFHMKIVSWNVNGIRAILKKDFEAQMNETKADIICVQETKAHPEQVPDFLPNYPHKNWASAEKKGVYER